MSAKKNITAKIEELKAKMDWFYGEEFNLDEAVEKYAQVLALSKEIEKELNELKNEIKVLDEKFGD
jgi:peptidoglycan hydrolase CwlO-like protein